jgi:TonB family protein
MVFQLRQYILAGNGNGFHWHKRAMKARFLVCSIFAVAALVVLTGAVKAKTYEVGADASADFVEAKPIYSPQPVIPPEKHENCFKSCCLVRFFISKEGKHRVKLIAGSGSNEIDDITLATLRRWKFKPAMLDGKPVDSTRRIKVEFEVN